MNLSRKTVLVIISTFIALVFVVAAVSDIILLQSFSGLERKILAQNIVKIVNEINETYPEISASARDYELLIEQRGLSFITSLDSASFVNHRIDVLLCLNRDGQLQAGRAADFHRRLIAEFTPAERDDYQRMAQQGFAAPNGQAHGLAFAGGVPVQFTTRRLDDETLLLAARRFDQHEIERLKDLTHARLEIRRAADRDLPDDFSRALAGFDTTGFFSEVLPDQQIAGYTALKGSDGSPALLVRLSEPRLIYEQGKTSIYYIFFVLLVSGLVLCSVTLMFIKGAVLERIASLGGRVRQISDNRDISARLPVEGEDELEDLATSINTMLESLAKAETAMRESEERYRLLFERAPDSIIIIGLEGEQAGQIVAANAAAAEQHGYTIEELCSRTIFEVNTPETNQIAGDIIQRISAGEWVTFEAWHFRKDGSRFPIEVHAGPLTIGGKRYLIGFDRDITIRKVTEETDRMYLDQIHQLNSELARQASELEAANSELETFNYSVSHDMRGPLTRISGYCQLIIDEQMAADPALRTYMSRIYESSCWLNEMIDAMLQLSRLTRAEFVPVQVDLSALVEECFRDLQIMEPDHHAQLVCRDTATVVGDRNLLKILIANLVGNAWKYSSKVPDPQIEFGILTDKPVPVHYIRDNGAGFDMKDAGALFTAFTRLHDPGQFSGTGIGLATAKRVVLRHGGKIWVESTLGGGATFYFTLQPDCESFQAA